MFYVMKVKFLLVTKFKSAIFPFTCKLTLKIVYIM